MATEKRQNHGLPAPGARASALSAIPRSKTTADEVEERIVLAIAMGEKSPGERITEAELATMLNVSRMPAREAIQKLHLRGILVEGDQRGMRVADYSAERVAELFELRHAIERVVLRRIMSEGFDRGPLLEELEEIIARMRSLVGSGDPLALGSIDMELHRAIVRHSGNQLAAKIWEGLAQHTIIVFLRDWASVADRTGEVELHERLVDFVRNGSIDDIDQKLYEHYTPADARPKRDKAGPLPDAAPNGT